MGMMRVAKGCDLGLIKYSEQGLACNKPELLKLLLSISSAKSLGTRKVTNYFLKFFLKKSDSPVAMILICLKRTIFV